jgi:hypothetical protein
LKNQLDNAQSDLVQAADRDNERSSTEFMYKVGIQHRGFRPTLDTLKDWTFVCAPFVIHDMQEMRSAISLRRAQTNKSKSLLWNIVPPEFLEHVVHLYFGSGSKILQTDVPVSLCDLC